MRGPYASSQTFSTAEIHAGAVAANATGAVAVIVTVTTTVTATAVANATGAVAALAFATATATSAASANSTVTIQGARTTYSGAVMGATSSVLADGDAVLGGIIQMSSTASVLAMASVGSKMDAAASVAVNGRITWNVSLSISSTASTVSIGTVVLEGQAAMHGSSTVVVSGIRKLPSILVAVTDSSRPTITSEAYEDLMFDWSITKASDANVDFIAT